MIHTKISTETLKATYGSDRLADRLLASLQDVGYDLDQLSAADLVTFDELHVMGRRATVALGRLAGLTDAMHVLDIGCGLGGSARTLAAEFGCHVTGIDLSAEFVNAARVLSERVGLADRLAFRHGDALDLPFAENRFDAACMLHVTMNIADKKGLFAEAARVLKPGGKLLLWEIFKTHESDLTYPVPWAEDESFSFLVPMDEMIALIESAGFNSLQIDDATAEAADWVRARLAPKRDARPRLPRPDLDLVLGNFRLKRANLSKNLLRGAVGVLRLEAKKDKG
ncbi:MAG: methyltransferase domain-containing protein [Deltaproteobacteria bacterium]|nr:methyltransferase domain-containing protein [Deltaproteobacteria bacterium]